MSENTDKPLTVLGMQVHTSPTMPDDAIDIVSAGKRTRFKVEPGPVVLRNCWTCIHNMHIHGDNDCGLNPGSQSTGAVPDAIREWARGVGVNDDNMPPKTADNCPGWKPKPEQEPWPGHIKVGSWVKFAEPIKVDGGVFDGRAKVMSMGRVGGEREFVVSEGGGDSARYPLSMADTFVACDGPKPEQANTDREQVAHLGAASFIEVEQPESVDELRTGSGDCKFCGTPFSWQVYFGPHGPRSYIPEDCGCKNRTAPDTITVQRAEWDALLARIDEIERRQRTDTARFQALRRRDKLRGTR